MKPFSTAFFLIISTVIFAQSTEGLVAYYPFNGNANDESTFDNHGTVDGATLTTDRFGNADSAYEFDGEDDIIRILDNESLWLNDEFTLVAWIMPYSVKDHTIIRKGGQTTLSAYPVYGLGLSGTSDYTFKVGTNQEPGYVATQLNGLVNPYELNVWTRIIARKDGESLTFITNDVDPDNPEAQGFSTYYGSVSGDLIHDTSPFIIGSRTQQFANSFEGKIDDIKLYNRFLTLEEVTGLNFSDDPVGINDELNRTFEVFPNPIANEFSIRIEDAHLSMPFVANIYSVQGNLITTQKTHEGTATFDASNLSKGVYFVELVSGPIRTVRKVIKP